MVQIPTKSVVSYHCITLKSLQTINSWLVLSPLFIMNTLLENFLGMFGNQDIPSGGPRNNVLEINPVDEIHSNDMCIFQSLVPQSTFNMSPNDPKLLGRVQNALFYDPLGFWFTFIGCLFTFWTKHNFTMHFLQFLHYLGLTQVWLARCELYHVIILIKIS